jgi:hypothetical protein
MAGFPDEPPTARHRPQREPIPTRASISGVAVGQEAAWAAVTPFPGFERQRNQASVASFLWEKRYPAGSTFEVQTSDLNMPAGFASRKA